MPKSRNRHDENSNVAAIFVVQAPAESDGPGRAVTHCG
jgi:hypothetical protein